MQAISPDSPHQVIGYLVGGIGVIGIRRFGGRIEQDHPPRITLLDLQRRLAREDLIASTMLDDRQRATRRG